MKLFLTSAGFGTPSLKDFFLQELPQNSLKTTVAMIAYTKNENELFYVNQSRDELKKMGFENIVLINLNDSQNCDFSKSGLIYVCGGNTFAILEKLRKKGFDKLIIDAVKNGAPYVGVSAGSIIAGQSVEIAGWGSEGDVNEVELKDLNGLNLTNIAVFPHYHDELKLELENFRKRASYSIQELTNEQMLYINDTEVKLVAYI